MQESVHQLVESRCIAYSCMRASAVNFDVRSLATSTTLLTRSGGRHHRGILWQIMPCVPSDLLRF